MGVEFYALSFLLEFKELGYSFQNTMTLGRQKFSTMSPATMCKVLRRHGYPDATDGVCAQILDGEDRYIEPLLRFLGAQRIDSIDVSEYEKATVLHDLNEPIPDSLKNAYTCVFDGGCLEHIFNFPQAIRNCMEMVDVGGTFVSVTPANNFMGHGFYQFSPELYYRVLSPENGFELKEMVLCELDPGAPRYRVKDAAKLGQRINLMNRVKTYMMVIAVRTAAVDIFATRPQQSFYTPVWSGEAKLDLEDEIPRGFLKSRLPYPLRKFVRRFRTVRDPFAADGFKRLDPY